MLRCLGNVASRLPWPIADWCLLLPGRDVVRGVGMSLYFVVRDPVGQACSKAGSRWGTAQGYEDVLRLCFKLGAAAPGTKGAGSHDARGGCDDASPSPRAY